jgi:hypothetical protein
VFLVAAISLGLVTTIGMLLFRAYVVYRERGPHDPGSRAPRRDWEKVGS